MNKELSKGFTTLHWPSDLAGIDKLRVRYHTVDPSFIVIDFISGDQSSANNYVAAGEGKFAVFKILRACEPGKALYDAVFVYISRAKPHQSGRNVPVGDPLIVTVTSPVKIDRAFDYTPARPHTPVEQQCIRGVWFGDYGEELHLSGPFYRIDGNYQESRLTS